MKEEINVRGKTFVVSELLARQFDEIQEKVESIEDEKKRNSESYRLQVQACANLTEDQYNSLTLFERTQITKCMNKLNSVDDFQKDLKEE